MMLLLMMMMIVTEEEEAAVVDLTLSVCLCRSVFGAISEEEEHLRSEFGEERRRRQSKRVAFQSAGE